MFVCLFIFGCTASSLQASSGCSEQVCSLVAMCGLLIVLVSLVAARGL